jgi:membrane-associated PAP2 superfamily phosphatase
MLSRVFLTAALCLSFTVLPLLAQTSSSTATETVAPTDSSHRFNSSVVSDSSQTSTAPSHPLRWYTMFENIPGDWSRYADESFRTDKIPEWLGIAALTGFLLLTDDVTWTISKGWYDRSQILRQVMYSFDKLGDGRGQFTTAGVFAAFGLLFNDERALRTASQTIQAILAAGTVVQVLKHITGRESPFLATAPGGVWRFFPNQIDYHQNVPRYDAYPSGHIESSLATVVVIAENYPEVTWIRPVGYTIVGLIGLGMAHTGIHWYSDYPLAIAIGYRFGMIAAHPEQSENSGSNAQLKLSVLPYALPGGGGISLSFKF